MNIIIFIKYVLIGLLSGYLIIYGLRPIVPYPEYILEFYDNFWLLLLLSFLNIYILIWDKTLGILLCLAIIALIFDMIILIK